MNLTTWLKRKRGRATILAEQLGISPAAIAQWKTNGVPLRHMHKVCELTEGQVSLNEMLTARPEVK